jgi:sugar lactone lactonase YvrE
VEQHTKDGALVLIAPSAAVTDVVADAKGAFWATKEATGARLHGPFPSVASLGTPASAVALALDADYLYFADTSAQQIRRAPRLPGNTQALAKESTPTIGSLAVDGNYVYWTADHGAPDGWALMRVSKCGGIPLTLGKGFARLTQLSFDDTYVYTAIVKSPTGSSLIRIAK